MALPREVDAEKVRVVNEAIANMSSKEIGALPPPDNDDLRLFGAISQHYCFLDLNLRRALEIMYMAKRLPKEYVKKYPSYTDAALSDILHECVNKMMVWSRIWKNLSIVWRRSGSVGRTEIY